MFEWLKKIFCKHDFEITRKTVKTKRWNDLGSCTGEEGYWTYGTGTQVNMICKSVVITLGIWNR